MSEGESDSIDDRLMQKVQYRKVGTIESLWVVHNVRTSASSTVRPQWAQLDVTGGVIVPTPVQQQIYAPDSTLHRWMGSLAVDKQGNMALGYSTSNGTNFPSIAYSGRLATDLVNTLPQSEVLWRNTTSGAVAIWFMNGGTVTSSAGLGAVTLDWTIAKAADFNGDGKADILWRNTTSGAVAMWLMNGGTVTSNLGLGTVTLDWVIDKAGDYNADAKADLLWRNTTSGAVTIWFMNGGAVTSTAGLGTVPTIWQTQ